MGKYLLRISNLEEKMIVGENLFNKYGNLLLKKGTPLTNELIHEIKKNVSDKVIYIEKKHYQQKVVKDERNPEIIRNNFKIIECYISSDIPNFDKCMCAVISKQE